MTNRKGSRTAALVASSPTRDVTDFPNMCAPIRSLIILLLLLCVPVFSGAHSHLSADPTVVRARALVVNERFDAALDILRPLDRDGPHKVDILFLAGLAAMGAAQAREDDAERDALLDEAIEALRDILHDRPELTRVRLELARAFFLKGEEDLSRDQFDRVLAGRPAPAVVANIHRYLGRIRARRRWSSYIGGSLAEDSNIGAVSDSEYIHIFGLPFRRDEESRATSGTGVVVWGGAEYQHPLTERLRVRAGTDLARREYGGSRFDQTTVAVHLGPRWLVDSDTEMSVLATARRNWAAGRPRSHAAGTRFEAEHRFSRSVRTRGQVSWQRRDVESSDRTDGPVLELMGSAAWLPASSVRVDAAGGYRRERTESIVWRNATRWVQAGVAVALPYGFTVGGGAEQRWTRYEGRWGVFTPGARPRRDRTRILRATLLNRSLTVFGFSPQIALVREVRNTNAQLYDYRRTRTELRLRRQF